MERKLVWSGQRPLPMGGAVFAAVLEDDSNNLCKVVGRTRGGFVVRVAQAEKGSPLTSSTTDGEYEKMRFVFSKTDIDLLGESLGF